MATDAERIVCPPHACPPVYETAVKAWDAEPLGLLKVNHVPWSIIARLSDDQWHTMNDLGNIFISEDELTRTCQRELDFVASTRDCFPTKCAASRSKTESPTDTILMLLPVISRRNAFFFQSAGSPLGHEAAYSACADTTNLRTCEQRQRHLLALVVHQGDCAAAAVAASHASAQHPAHGTKRQCQHRRVWAAGHGLRAKYTH